MNSPSNSGYPTTRPARLALLAIAVGATACGSGAVTQPATPAAAATVSVIVAPSSTQLAPRATATFTATVTGSANTAVTWSVLEGAPGGSVTSTGSYSAPAAIGIYHVVATSQADARASGSAAVTVAAAPAPTITSFTAAPSTIAAGGTSTLSWTVTGATSLSINQGIGAVTGTSRQVSPTATTTYVLTATNAGGSVTASATVTVTMAPPPPVIASFAAAPSTIAAGGTSTLSWTVTGATSLSIDQGIGTVTGTSRQVGPTATTTYVLTATNAGGSVNASATVTVTSPGGYVTPSPITGDVVVSLDSSSGTTAVSPYIFGSLSDQSFAATATGHRNGGNRMTGYNWETGYSNAGSDWGPYHNDTLMLGDGTPGSTYRQTLGSTWGRAANWRNGVLLTLPTIGYAAGTWTGNSTLRSSPDVLTVTPPLVGTGTATDRWRLSLPNRAGDPTHALATVAPALGDDSVYQDDFLLWLKTTWPGHGSTSAEPLFIALDNEPDLWASTHPEIRGQAPTQHVQTGFDELATNNVTYAKLVKDVLGAGALVFGPVLSGWMGFYDLGNVDSGGTAVAPPTGYSWYLEYYLKKMADASAADGRRLLDVVDVHWYPEASGPGGRIVGNDGAAQDAGNVTARVQAPRSLWDPDYLEDSWIVYWDVGIPGCTWGGPARNCALKLIPTLKSMIASRNPGTRIAVTEWSYGREMDVSNAVASADVFGIFAREGVHSAYTWPMSSSDGCLAAAMKAYLNYDGSWSHFGNTYIPGVNTDTARPVDTYMSGKARGDGTTVPTQYLERVTAYASFDAGSPGRVVVVAINKDLANTLTLGLRIKHDATFTKAQVFRVTGSNGGSGGCAGPAKQADIPITLTNAFQASLPPLSVTVLVLQP